MSKLGKIFLGIALVGAIASMVGGYLLIDKYNTTKTNLAQTADAKAKSDAEAAKQKAAALAAQQAKADADAKLTEVNGNVEKLTSQLADAQKAADAATGALTKATADAKTAQDNLEAINKTLNGQTAQSLVDAKVKAEADLAAAQNDEKIMKDNLDKSVQQIADLNNAINRKNTGEMPGVSGKITFVNRTWNFVVLNVGLANGVVPNGELIVYRNNTLLGKVKVTSVEANSAVADILPNVKGDIQVGDIVLN